MLFRPLALTEARSFDRSAEDFNNIFACHEYANRLTRALMQDLYDILGIPRDADVDTIKYAYRRRAKQMHPDVGGDASDFELLTLARRVLTDQHLRDQYDRTGRADIDSEDTKNQQALSIITTLLTGALANIQRIDIVDVIDQMRSNLAEAIRTGNGHISTGKQRIERLEQVRDRIYMLPNDRPNRLRQLLDGQIRIEQAAIERCKQQIAVHEAARAILDDYGYKIDQVQPLVFFSQAPF